MPHFRFSFEVTCLLGKNQYEIESHCVLSCLHIRLFVWPQCIAVSKPNWLARVSERREAKRIGKSRAEARGGWRKFAVLSPTKSDL